MKISEVFLSLQGEGVYTGIPTVFVRFQGCPLIPHCHYCDTPYALSSSGGNEISGEEVVQGVKTLYPYQKGWVCITGGEPLWQEESLEYLVRALKRQSYKITIETNGTFAPPKWWTLADSWNTDIKCPSSQVCGVSLDSWLQTRPQDQVKFVVGTKEDLDFVKVKLKGFLGGPVILVSPWNWDKEFLQAAWVFCVENGLRFSLQVHKVVWGNKKGV